METFEDVLKLVGGAGRWQLQVFLLAFFGGFPAALQDFLYIFIAATPDHWCHVPSCGTFSYDEMKNITIPFEETNGKTEFSKCSRYDIDLKIDAVDENSTTCNIMKYVATNQTTKCSVFDFDRSTFEETIVTEWNLVCDLEMLHSTSQAVYFVGGLFGCLIFGMISDNYGRRLTIILASIVTAIFGIVVAMAPNLTVLLVGRFFLSFGSSCIFGTTNVLVLETVEPDWRGLVGNLFAIPYGLGYASTAIFAYKFRNWRYLQIAVTVPVIIFLFLISFVPESPRWLINQGKAKRGEVILRAIAKTNGREDQIPANFSDEIKKIAFRERGRKPDLDSEKPRPLHVFQQLLNLFRTPKMRRRTLALNFCWFAVAMVYNGGAFSGPNLKANLFLYTLVSGLLDIPSYIVVPPLIKYFGRRITFSLSFLLCAVSLALSLLFQPGSLPIVVFAWLGILSIGSAYSLIYVYGAEIMPTSLRSYGLGIAAVVGRAGSLGGLYVTGLLGEIHKMAPTLVLALVSLGASIVAIALPETIRKSLPESVEDVENS